MTVKTHETFGENGQYSSNLENNGCSNEKKAIFAISICAIIALGFVLVEYYENTSTADVHTHNTSWDYLIFTQQWPVSFCAAYIEEKKETEDDCNFGDNKYAWSIHGIWPSQSNSSDYPEFCRRIRFNVTEIAPIETDLLEYWRTIPKNSIETSLWRHEWLKHGSCALQIEPLNTELKYFSQGLEWNKLYNITDALAKCEIYPDDGKKYTNDQVIDCVKQHFNVEPTLVCMFDNVRNEPLLTEVRLCLDKNLKLEGCDTLNAQLRCDGDFIYPATVTSS